MSTTYDETSEDVPPPAHSEIDWVVFDLGNVVLAETTALPELAALLGIPATTAPAEFATAYYAPRKEYDRTSDAHAYWSAVASGCGASAPNDELVARLTTLDNDGWCQTDPAVLSVIDDLARAGIRLAILSNASASMGAAVRHQSWARVFEHIVISGEINLVKPGPAIYAALLTTLGSSGPRVAFTDDRAENIAAAADAGIHAIGFTDADQLRSSLVDLGIAL